MLCEGECERMSGGRACTVFAELITKPEFQAQLSPPSRTRYIGAFKPKSAQLHKPVAYTRTRSQSGNHGCVGLASCS